DTDGDGLNDWEEYQLALDSLSATSNGEVDANGNPLSDYTYLMNLLKRLNTQGLSGSLAGPLKLRAGQAPGGPLIQASPVPTGTGLTGAYYTNSSYGYTEAVNFNPSHPFLTTSDPLIQSCWGSAITPHLSRSL